MILNLLLSEDLCVEDMMKKSFSEFHLLQNAPEREKMKKVVKEKLANLTSLNCQQCGSDVEGYYEMCKELRTLKESVQVIILCLHNEWIATKYGGLIECANTTIKNNRRPNFNCYKKSRSKTSRRFSDIRLLKIYIVLRIIMELPNNVYHCKY